MSVEGFILSVHITHKWVDIRDLEIFATKEARSLLKHIYNSPFVDECILVKTCNRLEIYIATANPGKARVGLKSMIERIGHGKGPDLFRFYLGERTARHLFKVTSGIDSMIVGEDQILGQVQDSLKFAKDEGTVGPVLGSLFEKAVKIGQKARQITRIGQGAVSVGSVAVDLAERELGTLDDKVILVLGAGEMGSLVARSLCRREMKAVLVANKTYEAAQQLASCLNGKAIRYRELPQYGKDADVMICATSAPHIILNKAEIEMMRKGVEKPLLIIDISVPVNIDPKCNELENVTVETMDDLKHIAEENKDRRRKEMANVEALIDEELKVFIHKYKEKDAKIVVKRLHELARKIRDQELERALTKLEAGEGELSWKMKSVIGDLTNAIIHKLLAVPTLSLKRASRNGDMETLELAARLFNLYSDEDSRFLDNGKVEEPKEGGTSFETTSKTEDEI